MRAAGLCVLALGGCAQVLGLDSPKAAQLTDGHGPDDGRSDGALTCRGDNFDDNVIDTSRWSVFMEAGDTVTETQQHLELAIDGSPGSAYCGVDAMSVLAATDTGVEMQVVQPSADDTSEVALVLFVNTNNELVIGKDSATLQMLVKIGGVKTSQAMAWDSSAYRWFRIEHNDKDVTFSTSRDGMMWTAAWATTADFAATQSLRPEIYAGHYMQVAAATVVVDNFAILPSNCP